MDDLISKQYASSLEEDAHWLTGYAQRKKDCQRLVEITTTMFRAAWALKNLPSAQPERLDLSEEDKRLFKKLRSFHSGSYANLLDRIMAKASAQPEQRWIPCSERLPDECKEVLVCYDFEGYRYVLIGTLYGDEFHGYEDEYLTPERRKYRKAVAWLPMPEPWKGEAE